MEGSGGEKEKPWVCDPANMAIHHGQSPLSTHSMPLVVSPPSSSAANLTPGSGLGGTWLFEGRKREKEKGRGKIPGSVVIAEIDKILMEDHLATDFSSSYSSSSTTPYSGPEAAWAIGLIQLRLKLLRTRSSEVS